MSDHEEFFRITKDVKIEIGNPDWNDPVTIEELYQAFKSRLLEEMQTNAAEEMEKVVTMLMRGSETIN